MGIIREFPPHIMEIISTIGRLVNRDYIIGTWCFQVLQCAVVQAFKRFGEQCFDKGYSHCHCVITLTQTFCDIPYEVHRYPMMPEAYRVIGISALNPNFLAPAVKMLYQHVVEKYKTIEEA